MSLGISDAFLTTVARQRGAELESNAELSMLTRYLAVLEDNKKASSFIPDDAALALDMAGFVRNRLHGGRAASGSSIARLALSLVHTSPDCPVQ
ncbi:MAG: hypothetical protein IJD16_07410 [Desulfovibrio sp.]|nr:hypothetical protein [Desulfovibrio sp.]